MQEIRTILLDGDTLGRGFAMVTSVDPIPNDFKRGIPAGFSYWDVKRRSDITTGYFAYRVSGWKDFSETRQAHQIVWVYFEKEHDSPIRIVRVEPYSVWKKNEL